MKHFEDFYRSHQTFEERSGEPDTFSAAVGRIALSFSHLEDVLSAAVGTLLRTNPEVTHIVTAELSFRQKVQMSAALVAHLDEERDLAWGDVPGSEAFAELATLCFKAEELRNQVMHSSWVGPYLRDQVATRVKTTAKTKGRRQTREEMDSGYLLDISDFTICVAEDVLLFFQIPESAVDSH